MIYFNNIMDKTKLNLYNIVGDSYCIEANDGQKVFKKIKYAFENGNKVEVSFLNIEIITTAFLNTAVGQLYKYYSEEKIKENLSVIDISESGKISLKRVVDTAKIYYNDPDSMERSINEILGE